ncbi:TrkH family potassium uptake protein [Thiorhodovibrio frisius]|uniref:Trk system potassium uptake protein n=1 Tax=Thiorhodovibrio frisius TaxID=631362 RepID=H8Z722_9GAMM|nr:TrkH family potassium uptake protein [Thiorhodovibrio frisius]EIC20821.1 potassium uptake protein, TrkH family [Thiorhodovibrio frisius]WPL21873.1 Trk system potassium uptake protein TrkH [Thiorhodovibrio frisius]
MHWRTVFRLFGLLFLFYSLSFLPSLGVAWLYQDGQMKEFVSSWLLCALLGLALWLPNHAKRQALSVREAFFVVALFWALIGAVAGLPFVLGLHLSVTDAVFESISGFTTTGATVMTGLDSLPPSILYHRQQIQWLGGMGMIVLAVAILPLMGVGGSQLYRAESSGVAKFEKLTPRIAETARSLWGIYVGLTLACALAYWAAGMTLFDAVGHAFATVATGGFSTHDASIGWFNSPLIESIAIVFMLAGGVNFAVHFVAWNRRNPLVYPRDPEARVYGGLFLGGSLFVALSLLWTQAYPGFAESLRYGAFQVASILTSTGFGTATFGEWPRHIPLTLVILSFIGGCIGSTAGGMKVMRVMLMARQGVQQLVHLAHPRAMMTLKLGGRPVDQDTQFSIWGFAVLYTFVTLMLTLAMMGLGLDFTSAVGAVVATINLLGPGLGEVASSFAGVDDAIKWLSLFAMLVGRLEVFTLLILFLPAYWRG